MATASDCSCCSPDSDRCLHTTILRIAGLDCADCADRLEKKLAAMTGVRTVAVNFGAAKLTAEHSLADAAIIRAVEEAGFLAVLSVPDGVKTPPGTSWRDNARTMATVGSGGLLFMGAVAGWVGVGAGIQEVLYAAAVIVGGFHPARTGLRNLGTLSLDMNVLMTVAIIGAAAIGQWSEGATVAFLFALGHTLQNYTLDKTRRSIRTLMELAPSEALVVRDGGESRLPVGAIGVGEVIIVKPGERIAMDGTVTSGGSAVDQAAITGESLPVTKGIGDAVYAGTINGQGKLAIKVTKVAADSTLARILQLVEEAQAQKAPSQQLVDRFAKVYTPAVLVSAAAVMTGPWLFGQPFAPWFYKGLVLLVISCPCALVISTPVSIVAAIGNASRRGVLVKGGAYLERLGSIRAVAFDKTGTLTHGRAEVTDVLPLGGRSEADFLATAAAVEKWSEHPLAQAVTERAAGLAEKSATNSRALTGRGAQADIEGITVFAGNRRLFGELGHSLAAYEEPLTALERQGKTVMLVGSRDSIWGMIAAADSLRDNARAAIDALRRAGIRHVAMLTGDNRLVAGSIAASLELDAYYSDLLPEDKVAAVKNLVERYGGVAMVGDGINDAPALAAADIGVAMGVAGTDAALETADIALMADDLGTLAYCIILSRKTVAVIRQNIAFAVLVKLVVIAMAFAGLANLWLAVFADTGASLLVTLNGMRLMRKITTR